MRPLTARCPSRTVAPWTPLTSICATLPIDASSSLVGRQVRLTDEDYDAILRNVDGVTHITGRYYLGGQFTVSYGKVVTSFDVRSVHPGHRFLENTEITEGRYINELDVAERRKVVVIGPVAVERLFKGKSPMGEWISVKGVMFRVVGVFKDDGGESEESTLYIPITTAHPMREANLADQTGVSIPGGQARSLIGNQERDRLVLEPVHVEPLIHSFPGGGPREVPDELIVALRAHGERKYGRHHRHWTL